MRPRLVLLLCCLVAGVCALSSGCPDTVTVSPCDTNNGGCLAHAVCLASSTNEVSCKCPVGYVGDGKTTCTQVATCSVINGAIVCSCLAGYTGNGTTCTRTTACAPDHCDPNAACAGEPDGGASCTCRTGFTTEPGDGGIPEVCIPQAGIVACGAKTCTANATCTTGGEGQAICTCDDGYAGDGITSCLLIPNGCSPDPCGANSSCANDAGTPSCTCAMGFISPSGKGNDCITGDPGNSCTEDADCLTGLCLTTEGQCSAAECSVPTPAPSAGSCVTVAAAETDAGLDDAGNATQTVCNPVTNAGCSAGDLCSPDNSSQNYYCLDAGSPSVALCGDCTSLTSICPAGTFCVGVQANGGGADQCAPLCCTPADCGDAGECVQLTTADGGTYGGGIGVCLIPY